MKTKTIRPPITVGLIRNRHPMPVSEYIFDRIDDVHDFGAINKGIWDFLDGRVGVEFATGTGANQCDYNDVRVRRGSKELVVYVTGLTAVSAALVYACAINGINLTLMHYDTETGGYCPQVFRW